MVTPQIWAGMGLSILVRQQAVLLRANEVLSKDPKSPHEGQLCAKIDMYGPVWGLVANRPGSIVERTIFFVRLKVWGWLPFPLFQLTLDIFEIPVTVTPQQ